MRFGEEIQEHLINFKEKLQYLPPTNSRKRWEYLEVTDNLYPPVRHGFMQYAYDDSIAFHDYARHVRSSQIFCFNIFYPLIKSRELVKYFKEKLNANIDDLIEWHFEYQPESDLLGEWLGKEKPIDYITSVDLFLLFRSISNKRIGYLIEVKFSEEEFSKCGGLGSNGNKYKDFCKSGFNINHFENECYLINTKQRKYYSLTKNTYIYGSDSKCPFAANNQCQRNHAFAKAIIGSKADEAYFGLAYHDRNNLIYNLWNKYKDSCVAIERESLFEIKVSDIIAYSNDETYKKYFRERYLL